MPAYRERLSELLSHPSVQALGHRTDLPDLMRSSDVLVLPSLEEGYGLVCVEAIGCGCVPLVSDACTEVCRHMENALVHSAGDVDALTEHLTMLHDDRSLLERLRQGALATAPDATWDRAGEVLVDAYRRAIDGGPAQRHDAAAASATAAPRCVHEDPAFRVGSPASHGCYL